MTIVPATRSALPVLLVCFLLLVFVPLASALPDVQETVAEPVTYLNFNEGAGLTALDASGHGNAGTLHNVSRVANGGCGGALAFDHLDNYVSIPYRSGNHPEKEITVSTWFYADSFEPRDLISTYNNGGYRIGFGDGDDLWWTVSLQGTGDVSIPVQHEGITPRQWHHVTGTYDGHTSKVYLDGVLRNQVNATGVITYSTPNYVLLGTAAGLYNTPDPLCPRYFQGGLDEVRIYDTAIPYNQIMDDRFRCSQELVAPAQETPSSSPVGAACLGNSGSLRLGPGESVIRNLQFSDKTENGTWQVSVPPGSKLVVRTKDLYSQAYPDAWYVELNDNKGRIDRTIAFPNTNNAPVEGIIASGDATVSIRYFDGKVRLPATVAVEFSCIPPPPAPPEPTQNILNNPIIVIYSASWATLIALVLVILWLHQRRKNRQERQQESERKNEEEKKD